MMEVVDNFARKVGILAVLRDGLAKRSHLLFRFVISFVLFGLVCGGTAARAHAEATPAASLGPGLTFAVADFDGDRRPDFASIQATQDRYTSDYSIQISLSQFGQQSLHLLAPVGGLVIEARDVDGNHTVDLLLSTAWRKQPVAIFLNNGRGGFSRAEVAAFPRAFNECKASLAFASNPARDVLGLSPQPGADTGLEENESGFDRSPARLSLSSSAGFTPDSFLTSHSGRAPPSEAHLS